MEGLTREDVQGRSGQREVTPGRTPQPPITDSQKAGRDASAGPAGSPRAQAAGPRRPRFPDQAPRSAPPMKARAPSSSLLSKCWEFPLKSGSPFIPAPFPSNSCPSAAGRRAGLGGLESPTPRPAAASCLCSGAQRHLRTDRRLPF